MVDKRIKLRAGLDLARLSGIEIGALDSPAVDRTDGRIVYVDHVDTDTLREKYRKDASIDGAAILDVDAVWGERTLAEAVGASGTADYVIASHVVEHVPDLITWLQEVAEVLKPGGELRLAIPDRRFTFDILRRETDLADILSAYLAKARRPGLTPILDFALRAVFVDSVAAWRDQVDPERLEPRYSPEIAIAWARDALAGNYQDVHCWVFTPHSFIALMHEVSKLGLLNFSCKAAEDTDMYHIEFIVTLEKNDDVAEVEASWARAAAHYKAARSPVSAYRDLPAADRPPPGAERMIEACDPDLFAILTAFSAGDRASFLGLLNLARQRDGYAYLEVGSDRGGSLQPPLSDPRCAVAFSIDLRVAAQPDERGRSFPFPDNTTAAMVETLRPLVRSAGLAKLRTFDCDLSAVAAKAIDRPVDIALIDAEHTNQAVFRDAVGVLRFLAPDSILMFHDANLVFDGLLNVHAMLQARGGPLWAGFLPDTVFAIGMGRFAPLMAERFGALAVPVEEYVKRSRAALYREILANQDHWSD